MNVSEKAKNKVYFPPLSQMPEENVISGLCLSNALPVETTLLLF